MDKHIEAVCRWIDKIGGVEKAEEMVKALKGMKDYQTFLLRVATTDEKARNFVAAALAGYTLGAIIYRGSHNKGWRMDS